MWIRFKAPWDWRLPSSTVSYRAGDYNVTRECADKAIAAGVATRLRKVSRDAEPVEELEPTEWLSEVVQAPSIAE